MKIWIDLSNSPHVLFFAPIISELGRRGHEVSVTARDFAQTLELCKRHGIPFAQIGVHGGKNKIRKVVNILGRAIVLRGWARHQAFDVAVSHNSYAHCIAAKLLGLPYVTLMDYEYQPANHINFRLADRVIVPFTFEMKDLSRYGASPKRTVRFDGLKEDAYLSDFAPDENFRRDLQEMIVKGGLAADLSEKILVTVRPPATMAAYHSFENPIFDRVMDHLSSLGNVVIILLPRTSEQKKELLNKGFNNVFIPPVALDGANLIYYSDLVISAGGTMNREAAVLGTPVYTIYKGKMGSVDKWMIRSGRMVDLSEDPDLGRIKLEKKVVRADNGNSKVLPFIVDNIISAAMVKRRGEAF